MSLAGSKRRRAAVEVRGCGQAAGQVKKRGSRSQNRKPLKPKGSQALGVQTAAWLRPPAGAAGPRCSASAAAPLRAAPPAAVLRPQTLDAPVGWLLLPVRMLSSPWLAWEGGGEGGRGQRRGGGGGEASDAVGGWQGHRPCQGWFTPAASASNACSCRRRALLIINPHHFQMLKGRRDSTCPLHRNKQAHVPLYRPPAKRRALCTAAELLVSMRATTQRHIVNNEQLTSLSSTKRSSGTRQAPCAATAPAPNMRALNTTDATLVRKKMITKEPPDIAMTFSRSLWGGVCRRVAGCAKKRCLLAKQQLRCRALLPLQSHASRCKRAPLLHAAFTLLCHTAPIRLSPLLHAAAAAACAAAAHLSSRPLTTRGPVRTANI